MDVQTVTGTTSTVNSTTESVSREVTKEMGKDEFMEILVAQLKNQDPLSPMENTEFIAQMTQFSVLEQIQNLNSSNSFAQACGLVGKQVYAVLAGDDGTTRSITGLVTSAQSIKGTPYLEVGGEMIPYTSDLIVFDKDVAI